MELITRRELSRRIGVSHTAINKAVKNGRIVNNTGTRKLNYLEAREQWFSNADTSKMSRERLKQFKRQKAAKA